MIVVVVVVALLVGARPTAGQLTTGDAMNLQLLATALGCGATDCSLTPPNCPSWTTCSSMRVVEIRLDKLRTAGTLPTTIGLLSTITHLRLTESPMLMGTIPSEIALLTRLELLELNQNGLTGTLPSSLATLSTLDVFDVSENRLTGAIPAIRSTGSAIFSTNQFTAVPPASLLVLQMASQLDLRRNYITSPLQFTSLTLSCMLNGTSDSNCFESCTGACCSSAISVVQPNCTPKAPPSQTLAPTKAATTTSTAATTPTTPTPAVITTTPTTTVSATASPTVTSKSSNVATTTSATTTPSVASSPASTSAVSGLSTTIATTALTTTISSFVNTTPSTPISATTMLSSSASSLSSSTMLQTTDDKKNETTELNSTLPATSATLSPSTSLEYILTTLAVALTSSSSLGLPPWAVIVIAVNACLCVVLFVIALACFAKKRRKQDSNVVGIASAPHAPPATYDMDTVSSAGSAGSSEYGVLPSSAKNGSGGYDFVAPKSFNSVMPSGDLLKASQVYDRITPDNSQAGSSNYVSMPSS